MYAEENSNSKSIALLGVLSGIIIAMNFIPYTGYISYGANISITTIHIPVIIGSIVLGWRKGLILGTVWGLACLVRAYITMDIEAMIFLDPRISVAPRIMVGFVAGYLGQILKGKNWSINKYGMIIAFVATLTNTVLVLSAYSMWGSDVIMSLNDTVKMIFKVGISINGILEIGLSCFLTPKILSSLRRANYFTY